MTYDFDRIVDRRGTNSVKWEFMAGFDARATDESIIPFWVADMDFPCAKPILDALHERVDREIFGYSSNNTEEYFAAVRSWYEKRFGWDVPVSDIVFCPGIVPAVGYLVELLSKPGDGIIIQRPVYYPFTIKIEDYGRTVANNALINDGGHYRIDFDDLERKCKDKNNKAFILCSPHNPGGRVWTEDELLRMGRICLDNGVTLISDEIHSDILRAGVRHIPIETLFPAEEDKLNIITLTAPSKTFNTAGLQLSNIIIHNPELRERWRKFIAKVGIGSPNPLAITATQAAYNLCSEWVDQLNTYLDENMRFIENFIAARMPKARFTPPEGTYLVWIDLSGYGIPRDELHERFITRAKVLVEAGEIFGDEGAGFIRLNAACPRSLLKEGMERIAKELETLG